MCGVCVASSGNQIGDEGARELADALRTNSTLQTLDLYGACWGRGGGRGVGRNGEGSSGGAVGGTGGVERQAYMQIPFFQSLYQVLDCVYRMLERLSDLSKGHELDDPSDT